MDNIDIKKRIMALAIGTTVLINCLVYAEVQNLTGEGLSPLPLTDELSLENDLEADVSNKGKERTRKIKEVYHKPNGYLHTTHNG